MAVGCEFESKPIKKSILQDNEKELIGLKDIGKVALFGGPAPTLKLRAQA
ncbi:MAG: hypothetical protein DHS20C18_14010 [Saprospiraceae bacterium]|nr:MAG: hypothetical protein DHS20C18_14010 [Saprospiraceae bacterium]